MQNSSLNNNECNVFGKNMVIDKSIFNINNTSNNSHANCIEEKYPY